MIRSHMHLSMQTTGSSPLHQSVSTVTYSVLWTYFNTLISWQFGLVVTCVSLDQRSCATSDPVSTRMGDHMWVGKPPRYVTSQLGRLSLLPSVGRYNEYPLLGWVIIINGDGGCTFWQPVQADSQPKSSGLVLGRGHLAPFYIHQMIRVNSRNGSAMMTTP